MDKMHYYPEVGVPLYLEQWVVVHRTDDSCYIVNRTHMDRYYLDRNGNVRAWADYWNTKEEANEALRQHLSNLNMVVIDG